MKLSTRQKIVFPLDGQEESIGQTWSAQATPSQDRPGIANPSKTLTQRNTGRLGAFIGTGWGLARGKHAGTKEKTLQALRKPAGVGLLQETAPSLRQRAERNEKKHGQSYAHEDNEVKNRIHVYADTVRRQKSPTG